MEKKPTAVDSIHEQIHNTSVWAILLVKLQCQLF